MNAPRFEAERHATGPREEVHGNGSAAFWILKFGFHLVQKNTRRNWWFVELFLEGDSVWNRRKHTRPSWNGKHESRRNGAAGRFDGGWWWAECQLCSENGLNKDGWQM